MIATDPLSLFFIFCFGFGLLFLLIVAMMGSIGHGHVHDVGGHHFSDLLHTHHVDTGYGDHGAHGHNDGMITDGDGGDHHFSLLAILNPTAIVLFLLWFGFFGYLFKNGVHFEFPLTMILSIVGGVIIAALILKLLNRIAGGSEGETIQDVSDRTGLVGKVTLTIQEGSIGEIMYTSPSGLRKSIPARSVDGRRLERGQEVVVLSYQKGVAEVDTWEHFVSQEQENPEALPDASALDELEAFLKESDHPSESTMRKDLQKE
ncbi:hypothetical protein EI42_00550 [Thermosporothrix hazakensis]|jgi:hypothetical protein|uniref:NfeD-like C-terminal domain-containing protein n=1 Tax=Thermosporothrix hazakensis TaxID=644383 RepID=A0A326UDL3_THEHA|nr:hypothetical protein [Thermosporothrix hazakensis]PZW36376.1 hypothetical protein EI42_00550 [Thermosporothrix hazakensis]GCE47025.1 hypothetical protein KTH_18940 [Thermosporothrix hazakensis]